MSAYQSNTSPYYAFLPMLLACDEKYQKLSAKSCYLYSLMLSRYNLSAKNKHRFTDENGVFIYFSIKEMCQYLHCSEPTAILAVQELLSVGLITRENAPNGKSPKYYVKQLDTVPQKTTAKTDVSFDVEAAKDTSKINRADFGTKKNPKRRKRYSDSSFSSL